VSVSNDVTATTAAAARRPHLCFARILMSCQV
jgi:hypothetical protein